MAEEPLQVAIARSIPERFESARLLVRRPRPGDGADHFAAVAESLDRLRRFPASLSWAMAAPSLEASERFCREGALGWNDRTTMPMLLFLKDTGRFVGCSGLDDFDLGAGRCEIGFWIRTGHGGCGLAAEAVRAIAAFAFAHLGIRRIEALPDEENLPSCRVCEQAGFRLECTLPGERRDPAGRLRNTRRYVLTN
jgi:hypothetical protein